MHDNMEGEFIEYIQNRSAESELIYNQNLKTHLQMICKNSGKNYYSIKYNRI